jgi:hypothetical protein
MVALILGHNPMKSPFILWQCLVKLDEIWRGVAPPDAVTGSPTALGYGKIRAEYPAHVRFELTTFQTRPFPRPKCL